MGIIETLKRLKHTIILIILLNILFVLVCLHMYMFVVASYGKDINNHLNYQQGYIVRSWNPNTWKKGQQFVTLFQDEENLMLMSKFGSKRFACTGTCHCSPNDDDRRSSPSTLRIGVKTFLAAASVFSAMKISEIVFREDCQNHHFSETTCPPETHTIISEIENCEDDEEERMLGPDMEDDQKNYVDEMEDYFKTLDVPDELKDMDEGQLKYQIEKKKYACEGYCVHSEKYLVIQKNADHMINEDDLSSFCEGIKFSDTVSVRPAQNEKEVFQYYHLAPVCHAGGSKIGMENVQTLFDSVHEMYGQKKVDPELKGDVGKCTDSNPPEFINPTITCSEILPGSAAKEEEEKKNTL